MMQAAVNTVDVDTHPVWSGSDAEEKPHTFPFFALLRKRNTYTLIPQPRFASLVPLHPCIHHFHTMVAAALTMLAVAPPTRPSSNHSIHSGHSVRSVRRLATSLTPTDPLPPSSNLMSSTSSTSRSPTCQRRPKPSIPTAQTSTRRVTAPRTTSCWRSRGSRARLAR